MTYLDQLKEIFRSNQIPTIVEKLARYSNDNLDQFSESFEFLLGSDKYMLSTYSEELTFLESIIDFAQADAGGSVYGIWAKNPNQDLGEQPVIVFGNDGGYHVISENFKDFLQILAYDAEPMVGWDYVTYYKDEDDEGSDGNPDYIRWVKEELSIQEIKTPDEIIESAKKAEQENFESWIKQYYSD